MNGLQIVFLVMCVLGGINLARPAHNTAVLMFRLAVVAIGLVGSVVVLVLYLRLNRSSDDSDDEDDDRPRRRRRRRDDDRDED
jgi:hypothetical protein